MAVDDKVLDQVAGGITVETGAETSGCVAYLVAADGSETIIQKSYVENGKLYAKLPGSAEIVIRDNTKTFRDTGGSWARDAIDFAASRELFRGVNETDFAPEQTMTRAMLVTVLHRMEGKKTVGENKFTDVPADAWYAGAVAWANANGVVNGTSETGFSPNANVSREQMATILYRYATKLCGEKEVRGDSKVLEKFSDRAALSGFAADGMAWCVEQGIINGRGDGILAPAGYASRAEVAAMLQRFVKVII